ncbi:hypothetical protein N7U49_40690 [Streptomyces sp. AD2-2]|nr:hypothetical protein N7U49_40690 [Streptomyces sp. AD2-2]
MALSSRAFASRTTPAGLPPSGSLEKAVYRSTSGRGGFVVIPAATWGGSRPFPEVSGADASEGDDIFRDRAAAPNTRRAARGYDVRRDSTPPARAPPPHAGPARRSLRRALRHLPPEVPHTFSMNRRADTSRPEAATTSLREHHTLHIEEVRR